MKREHCGTDDICPQCFMFMQGRFILLKVSSRISRAVQELSMVRSLGLLGWWIMSAEGRAQRGPNLSQKHQS